MILMKIGGTNPQLGIIIFIIIIIIIIIITRLLLFPSRWV